MTQKDISDLLDADVSWQAGTITRKRSKTANHAGVPSVTYQLWPETFRLLQQHRSQKEVVLLTKAGKRLVEERLDETGAYRKSDSVKSAYDRGMAKLPFSKPFKLLRKTSATMIHANPQFRGLDPLFLGHAPRRSRRGTMSRRVSRRSMTRWSGCEPSTGLRTVSLSIRENEGRKACSVSWTHQLRILPPD